MIGLYPNPVKDLYVITEVNLSKSYFLYLDFKERLRAINEVKLSQKHS